MPSFKRKANDLNGVATIHVQQKFNPDIIITGNCIYQTDDKQEIEALRKDDSIVEVKVNRKGRIEVVAE